MKTNYTYFKYLSILMIGMLFSSVSFAQLTYVPTPGGSSSANFRGPCASCGFQRYVGIYPGSEISGLLPSGDSLRAMSFNILTPQTTAVSGNMIILISNTSDLDYQKGSSWSAAIANMDTVYDGPMTVPSVAGFYDIVFQNAVEYTGDGIYLAYQWTTSGTLAGAEPTYSANTAFNPGMVRNQNSTAHSDALGSTAQWRVQLRLAYQTAAIDLGVSNPGTSGSPCGGTGANFDFQVINAGASSVDTIFYHYDITGPSTSLSDDTFAVSTLNPGDTLLISRNETLTNSGEYFFTAYLTQPNDAIPLNDTLSNVKVAKLDVVSSFPYLEDFDGASQGWSSDAISGPNDWELATPSGSVINSASSGANAWVTNAAGDYAVSQDSWVNSPCFDLSSNTSPEIQAQIWWNIETDWDAALLESSIDDGQTWNVVGSLGSGVNWYNNNAATLVVPEGWSGDPGSGGYVNATQALSGLGGLPNVRLRFRFVSDGSVVANGFAFDDVSIISTSVSAPTAGFTYVNSSGNTVDFTDASTGTIDTFAWDFGDGNTSMMQNPTHTYASAGNYNACLTVSNSAGSDTFCDTVSILSGIKQNVIAGLKLYPNPSNGIVSIEFENQYSSAAVLLITDVFGRKVYEEELSQSSGLVKKSIDMQNLSKGIYFIDIRVGDKNSIRRIILE
ncbi:PKD domain-containing protein [Hyphobacterium sp. CCMP332]|nr:PKD domain-containing protein [Hyphobacterium sp. CCMP332]